MHQSLSLLKKIFQLIVFFIASVFYCIQLQAQQNCTPVNLTCEYMENLLGIDAAQPRLSWQLKDTRSGASQSAYQVFVGTDSQAVNNSKGNTWQTKKLSDTKQLIVFDGKPLQPFTKYFWTVKVWDKDGVSAIAKAVSFETGMMDVKNWKGSWIKNLRRLILWTFNRDDKSNLPQLVISTLIGPFCSRFEGSCVSTFIGSGF